MSYRITKQTRDTLRAIGEGSTRESLAKRLAIPYSSLCGRIRRMVAAGLADCQADTVVVTNDGFDASLKEG